MPEPVPPKAKNFANAAINEKLFVSLEEITSLRGIEKLQELCFLILGYRWEHKVPENDHQTVQEDATNVKNKSEFPFPEGDDLLSRLLPDSKLSMARDLLFARVTPIFTIRRGSPHVFPGGLPLYYGTPGDITSLYFAVIESDRGARGWGEKIQKSEESLKAIGGGLANLISAQPQIDTVKQAFQLLIKGMELVLVNNKDNIRYTNVLTFKKWNGYLGGTHRDWGNQRIAFTLQVDPPDTAIPPMPANF